MEKSEEGDTAKDCIGLGDLGALFQLVENRIFRKFLVKLVDIITGLVLRLDENRVLLDFLSGRHSVQRKELKERLERGG